jgi:predicted dehydrogenase
MGEPKAGSVKASIYSNGGLAVEDSAAVFVQLDNGATLTIEVSWTLLMNNDFFYTNLFGKNGGALLNPLRIHKELHGNLVNVTPVKEETLENLYKKSYENEIRHFIAALNDKTVPITSEEDNLERMRIVDAVYESAKTCREIVL